jgi:CheY-like chemotaxis protein/anti-sigma regulatory factor (Ser/Thr protein kinase)
LKDCSSKYSKIANEKDVKFDVKYLGSIPENVTGDPVRISQIISALMSNAVKFTEKGKVEVTVDKLSNKSNVVFESVLIPFHLRVTVIDSGCGIDDSVLSRLFNPYSNEKLSVSREEKGGTGLGLAICKKLVEAMQGSITVETNIGKGSKFSVTLPLFETSSPEIQTDRLLAEEAPQDILKDIKVLYADDQPIIQKFLSRYLDSYTQNIALVNDGLEAVRYVRKSVQIHRNHSPSRSSSKSSSFSQIPEFIPQIIILDLQMPNLNGIEAAKLIHAIDPTLSKILISGSDPPQNLSPNLFKATLLKPLSKEQFISVLTKIHTQNNK